MANRGSKKPRHSGNEREATCCRNCAVLEVNIIAFPRSRVTGYRWPAGQTDVPQSLPLVNAEKSISEA